MGENQVPAWGESADPILELLTRHADQLGRTSQEITLYLPGIVVVGRVAGASRWFQTQAELAEVEAKGEDPTLLAMSAMQETLAEEAQAVAQAAPQYPSGSPPSLIHVEVQAIWVGALKLTPSFPCVWRGKLSQVVGWNYGAIGL